MIGVRETIALVILATGFFLAFVVRAVVHFKQTGSFGIKGVSGPPGSVEWWVGLLFIFSQLLAPAAAIVDRPERHVELLTSDRLLWFGILLMGGGIAGIVRSQRAMGRSWRVGVDPTEVTDLVTEGIFGWIRNPIYTWMLVVSAGLVLVVPNLLALTHFALLLIALDLQVRVVEEPYLIQRHGRAYLEYAKRVGRFLPGIGRI